MGYVVHQVVQLVSAEEFYQSTLFADEDVLVPGIGSDKGLAAGGLVDPLDKADLFKFSRVR
jgi:hypothetical protein